MNEFLHCHAGLPTLLHVKVGCGNWRGDGIAFDVVQPFVNGVDYTME